MIYDDLKKCSITDLELLIDKLRVKLSVANDRLVMLETEVDVHFMIYCESQEELDVLRGKGNDLVSVIQNLLLRVDSVKANLSGELLHEFAKVECALEEFCSDSDGMPF